MSGSTTSQQLEALQLPAMEFAAALAAIDHLAELKLALRCLTMLQQKEAPYRYLRYDELLADELLMRALGTQDSLVDALQRAISRGLLLEAQVAADGCMRRLITWNDADGRAWQRQILAGEWQPAAADEIETLPPRPSLYALYEDNLGLLTPMIAESIRDAESAYPRDWIEDAMRYAAQRNARSWRYVHKVLENWQQEGRSREADNGGPQKPRHQTGKWKHFIDS
ncbi:MAG: DnaD domain protein [Chloroflexi bacterium]|nr:DnaD domain protein [Chloroflexota bacterium]MCY4246743.1 DnaD domain protein [Chloroflexota bacterium]